MRGIKSQSFLKRISLNTLWLLLARAGGQGLAFLFTVLVARYLGEVGLGQYAFIAAVVFVGNVFSTFGMDTLLIREIAGRRGAIGSTFIAGLLIQLGLSLLFTLVAYGGARHLPNQTQETVATLRLATLSLLPLAFSTVYSAAMRAYERMDLYLLFNLATAVFQVLAAFFLLRSGSGLLGLGWVLIGTQVIGAVTAAALCLFLLPGFARDFKLANLRLTHPVIWRTLRTGSTLAFLMVMAVIYQRLGIFSLSLLADDANTGWFSAAARLIEALKMIPYAFFGALFPVMARGALQSGESTSELTRGDDLNAISQPFKSEGRSVYDFSFLALLLLTIGTAVGMSLVAARVVTWLFGDAYAPSIIALQILVWSLIPFAITLKLSFELVSVGREHVALKAMVLTLLVTEVCLLFFIQEWGLAGACWAIVIGETAQAIILLKRRKMPRPVVGDEFARGA